MSEVAGASAAGLHARIVNAFDRLITVMNGIGTAWIFVLMLAINADVFSRFLFNAPISGVPLTIEMSIVAIVFLQIAAALRGGRLTRSEILITRLLAKRPQLGYGLQASYHAAGAALMTVLFIYSEPLLEKAYSRGTYAGLEGDFTLPVWPLKALILLGTAVCAIQFARHVGLDIRTLRAVLKRERGKLGSLLIPVLSVAAVAFAFYAMDAVLNLSPLQVGTISVLFVLLLVYVGVHVGVALASLSFICLWVIYDTSVAGKLLALAAAESLQRYEFGVIPLFVLMGLLVSVSDIGKDTYDVANHVFRRVKAGLGMGTVGANAVFAAVTGTSIASASVFTKVAVPEMLRLGYRPRFAVGVVAGSSVLGMLIPPSLLMILYGILSETSIGDLFIAGIVPGILLAAAFCVLIRFMAWRFPDKVATNEALSRGIESDMSATEVVFKSVPIIALIALVIGGIYGGVFTATEAGGVGALGALLLAVVKRRLTWDGLWTALAETGHVTASILFLLISALLYARMIAMTGIPNQMEGWVAGSGLGLVGLMAIYIAVLVILGTIMSAGEIMLITVPLAVPALSVFDVDLIWLGIVTIIGVEIGLLTPPLGIACFVIHNNLQEDGISIEDIFWGAAPFALTMLVVLIAVALVPDLATMLL